MGRTPNWKKGCYVILAMGSFCLLLQVVIIFCMFFAMSLSSKHFPTNSWMRFLLIKDLVREVPKEGLRNATYRFDPGDGYPSNNGVYGTYDPDSTTERNIAKYISGQGFDLKTSAGENCNPCESFYIRARNSSLSEQITLTTSTEAGKTMLFLTYRKRSTQ